MYDFKYTKNNFYIKYLRYFIEAYSMESKAIVTCYLEKKFLDFFFNLNNLLSI